MIVIHIDNKPDTKKLSLLYEGLDDVTLCYNMPKRKIKKILMATPGETVMMLGHGDVRGLYNVAMDGYAVDWSLVEWLRGRTVIGIFCYASEFADRYGLHGFFTSMFISNMNEALMLGMHENATDELIDVQEELFCRRVRSLIDDKVDISTWDSMLQVEADTSIPFVRFNYEALAVL